MPAGDRTGPDGMGPMTGRRMGFCAGYDTPGYTRGAYNRGGGYGWRTSRGGHGRRNMYYATGLPGWMRYGSFAPVPPAYAPRSTSPEDELRMLREQADALRGQMEIVSARIEELESSSKRASGKGKS